MTDPGQGIDPPPYPAYPQTPAGLAYPSAPTAPDGRPLAGGGDRLLARLIDGLVQVGAVIVVVIPFVLLISVAQGHGALPAIVITCLVLALLALSYLYEVEWPLRHNGQTIGKRARHIAIVKLDPGAGLTRGSLAARWGVLQLGNLLSNCYVGLLDPLWLLWDKPYRQCLHDKAAHTTVVRLMG